jgi:hypothetical protein
MTRNLGAAALLMAGVALLSWSLVDWVAYSGFSISLLWQ